MIQKVLILDALVGATGIHEIDNISGVLQKDSDSFALIPFHLHTHAITADHIAAADKIIVSGSSASVYDHKLWMKKLEFAFTQILSQHKPTLAICFGAQFLAQMLGAEVSKNSQGLEFGSIQLSLTDEGEDHTVLRGFHRAHYVHATHNDVIGTLPRGASLLAYNDNSPIQAYQYQSILATQFHPDVPVKTMQELLASRKEKYTAMQFIRNEQHFQQLHQELVLGASGHTILKRFLTTPH